MTGACQGLLAVPRLRFAGLPAGFEPAPFQVQPPLRLRAGERKGFWRRQTVRGGPGVALAILLFGATGLYGAMRNGDYTAFVQRYGSPADLMAKAAGFSLKVIAIVGPKALDAHEVLDAAGIDPSKSLLFIDAAGVRDRLMALPLVRDAVVSKLFPDRLTIALEERDPVAIWQVGGKLSIVSGDGVVIDTLNDDRFVGLPFVVGAGANTRVAEFLKLLDGMGDLRTRVSAGMLVGERRWTLKMDNGIEVQLPEDGAAAAVAELVALDKQSKVLDKDIVSLDLRIPGRFTARLSDAAAAARAETLAKKTKAKGSSE